MGHPIANDPCYGGIVFNGIKDLDNPEFLKIHQITQINFNENNDNNNNNDDINNEISASEVMCYKIWLHAFNYKFDKYEFETKRPDWSLEDYDPGFIF